MEEFYNISTEAANYDALIKAIMEELQVNYMQYGWIFRDKFLWKYGSWNEIDELNIGKQICQSVVNMVCSDPITVWTPSENINKKIELDLMGRMKFNSVLAENLVQCMITGDMLMSVSRDEYDGQLAINYATGPDVIFMAWNNHAIHKVAWFTREYVGKEAFIVLTIEDAFSRTKLLYKFDGVTLIPYDIGTSEWINIMGSTPSQVFFNDPIPYKRFACVSTAKKDGKWDKTKYHNSLLYPMKEIEQFNKDWAWGNKEFELATMALFADPTLFDETENERERQHLPSIKRDPAVGGLYRMLAVGKQMLYTHAPNIRFEQWYKKMQANLQFICASRGLNASILQLEVPTKEMSATEAVLSNKQTQNTIKNIEENLKPAIQTVVYALICEWYKEGSISAEDFASISNVGCIDVRFSDGFYRNREQTVTMYNGIWNLQNEDGSKLITHEMYLRDGLGLTKEHAQAVIFQCQQEHKEKMLVAAQTNAEQQVVQVATLAENGVNLQEEKPKEKPKQKKEEKK